MTFDEWFNQQHFDIFPDMYQEEYLKNAFEAGYEEGYDDASYNSTGGY